MPVREPSCLKSEECYDLAGFYMSATTRFSRTPGTKIDIKNSRTSSESLGCFGSLMAVSFAIMIDDGYTNFFPRSMCSMKAVPKFIR